MTRFTDQIADQAMDWLSRQDAMAPADWLRFVEWLEADPRHAEAFDHIAMADGALADRVRADGALSEGKDRAAERGLPEPANDRGAPGLRWSRWIGGAAACAAAAGAVFMLRPAAPDIYVVETRPGETRLIQLAEGSHVEIAGGSRLLFDRASPRRVTLDRGDALFHVRHDAKDPFTVRSGKLEVQDVGTVFNVTRDGPSFAVAVAEGSVMFQPDAEAVPLAAGATLAVREDLREVRLGRIDTSLVGGWRSGRLSFANAPVPQVLGTIQRLYGTRLVANDGLSSRTVTGIITISGEARRDVPHIASMIGASWRADGERWILSPAEDKQP